MAVPSELLVIGNGIGETRKETFVKIQKGAAKWSS